MFTDQDLDLTVEELRRRTLKEQLAKKNFRALLQTGPKRQYRAYIFPGTRAERPDNPYDKKGHAEAKLRSYKDGSGFSSLSIGGVPFIWKKQRVNTQTGQPPHFR